MTQKLLPDAGVAVLSVMLVTTCLVSLVMLIVWETPLLLVLPFTLFFLTLEGVYFSANIIKASHHYCCHAELMFSEAHSLKSCHGGLAYL